MPCCSSYYLKIKIYISTVVLCIKYTWGPLVWGGGGTYAYYLIFSLSVLLPLLLLHVRMFACPLACLSTELLVCLLAMSLRGRGVVCTNFQWVRGLIWNFTPVLRGLISMSLSLCISCTGLYYSLYISSLGRVYYCTLLLDTSSLSVSLRGEGISHTQGLWPLSPGTVWGGSWWGTTATISTCTTSVQLYTSCCVRRWSGISRLEFAL
jgi:hypothetical protein